MKLTFVADDYGISEAMNSAIEKTCSGGVIRRVTILPHERCVISRWAKENIDKIVWGAHLYLTEFEALNPEIYKKQKLYSKNDILKEILLRKITLPDVFNEFDLQIKKLRELGIKITFIDSHQNIHAIPIIGRLITKIAQKYGLENAIRPVKQLNFDHKNNLRTIISGFSARFTGDRSCSRVVINCPGFKKETLKLQEALRLWEGFLARVSKKDYNELIVPCHPGISPAEAMIYTSLEFIKLLEKYKAMQ